MADQNPTRSGDAAAPDLPAEHIPILRGVLTTCLEGLRADLVNPDRLRNPAKAREEAAAYERLLAGLAEGRITVPDEHAHEAVAALAMASDEENNYAELVAEHDALRELLARLEAGRS